MTYQEWARNLDDLDDAALDFEPRYRRMAWLRLHSSLTNLAQLVLTPPVVEVPAPRPTTPARIGADVVGRAEAAKMLGLSEKTLEDAKWDFLRFHNGSRRVLYKVATITKHLEEEERKHHARQG